MQTTLTDQIKAIQVMRKFISENVGMVEGMSSTDLDRALNDAGATITALKMTTLSIQSEQIGENVAVFTAVSFFKSLNT